MKDRTFASALHLITALAYQFPEAMSSEILARTMQTNPGVVRRLLARLAKAKLVKTTRGAGGGAVLARSPEQITALDVRRAISEGPVFHGFEKEPYKACPVSCQMKAILEGTFDRFEQTLERDMAKLKISELVKQVS